MCALARAEHVTVRFGSFVAVSDVSVHVEAGEVVGLLGANGAGKTTLIRLLLGLVRPNRGAVWLLGSAPSLASRRRVGYVPQTLGLYADMTVEENWRFTAGVFGLPGRPVPEGASQWRGELVGTLSLGAQRRVALALAFSHHPELLFLDEPTSGVSSLNRARLWDQVRSAAEGGAGVLVTTHNMEEAEECDRLVLMADGRIVASGTAAQVVGEREVTEVSRTDWRRALQLLDAAGLPVQFHAGRLRVDAPSRAVAEVLARHDLGATVKRVPANLDEAFMATVAGTR